MNANELIKKLERAKGVVYNEMGCDELIVLAIEESQKIIDRARIRVTAEEKPTREDGIGCLCAIDDMNCWHFKKWYEIADCPSTYVLWFIMPDVQLPEVTP